MQELARLGRIKEASTEIRAYQCSPLFKLYILNGEQAFFGPLVVARTSHAPALLKASPHLNEKAARSLGADPAASALIGDSLTDIEAAHHVGVASIGYAYNPGKQERMTELRAGAVMASTADLALSLRTPRANGANGEL